MSEREQAVIGCLLGAAVGDALGLPYEGLTGARGSLMFPDRGRFHFLPGYGMVSDDTEHACFTAQAIVRSHGEPDRFEKELARSLRRWLLGLPAGIGLATLRSVLRLWLGVPPAQSGVLSAGNGPAMRGPLLGVAYGDSPERLKEFVHRSVRMTHQDPKAYYGSLGVAIAAHISAKGTPVSPRAYLDAVKAYMTHGTAQELLGLLGKACTSADRGESVAALADAIGSRKGITGSMYHTVPCIVQVWLRHQLDFEGGVREIISAGGDTDTTAAILGGIIGAGVGKAGLPERLLTRVVEWPRSITWMENVATAVSRAMQGDESVVVPGYFVPGIVVRNSVFMMFVLLHGLRRVFPPY